MNNPGELDVQERVDSVWPHHSIGKHSSSDRIIVLNILAEFAEAGLGVLEGTPGLGPQFLSLKSGEVFWLRANEITRIK